MNGLKNRDLAQLTSSYIISLPFNFTVFRDFVAQYEQQIPTQSSSVHAITNLRCYRCEGNHLLRDCRKLKCMKCGGPHTSNNCKVPSKELKCSMTNQTTAAHIDWRKPAPQVDRVLEEVGVFTCFTAGTSFVDGAVSINTGVRGQESSPRRDF